MPISYLQLGTFSACGLVFFVFGLNGFLHFIPQPPPTGAMADFAHGLVGAGYFFPLLKGTEVTMGALLLSNRFVPLALTVLASIIVNIFAVHVFLAPAGLPLAFVLVALETYLAYAYRDAFASVLHARTTPRTAPVRSPEIVAPSHALAR
jgi:hypothetical protein